MFRFILFIALFPLVTEAVICKYASSIRLEERLQKIERVSDYSVPDRKFFSEKNNFRPLLKDFIRHFDPHSEYSFLFPNGKGLKLSVAVHSLRTMRRLRHQIEMGSIFIKKPIFKDYERALFLALMVHDVAKSYAYKSGNNLNQLPMNFKLASAIVDRFSGLNLEEKNFIKAILKSAKIGVYLQAKISAQEVLQANFEGAQSTNMKAAQYLRFMEAFFLADAGSYEHLASRPNIMEIDRHGGLKISSPAWRSFLSRHPEDLFY